MRYIHQNQSYRDSFVPFHKRIYNVCPCNKAHTENENWSLGLIQQRNKLHVFENEL